MNSKLKIILREVAFNQAASLRVRDKKGQQILQVRVAFGADGFLHCIDTGKTPGGIKFSYKTVHLVQKHHGDYFFISGHLSDQVHENPRIFSIAIFKASWFVRKRRGNVSWFREKHTYEKGLKEVCLAS